ncbi:hypothetical protein DITRI_Ditri02bG0091600 [Diplodiscus trichospermus]
MVALKHGMDGILVKVTVKGQREECLGIMLDSVLAHVDICMIPSRFYRTVLSHLVDFVEAGRNVQVVNEWFDNKWIEPIEGVMKINVDASYNSHTQTTKTGVVEEIPMARSGFVMPSATHLFCLYFKWNS